MCYHEAAIFDSPLNQTVTVKVVGDIASELAVAMTLHSCLGQPVPLSHVRS